MRGSATTGSAKRSGITAPRWAAAKSSLVDRGLLSRAGAVTLMGRNAIGNERLR
jgi:hypothetical protein